jgi:AcrR family transcriptional regulator
MTSRRRIGASDSVTRAKLLDAAERLLLDEGYAAVTSRRVGQEAVVSPQLVHYYFRTMDDLFLEVFRRRAEEGIAQFTAAMDAERSIRTIWDLRNPGPEARFNLEFVALANHRKAIQAEIASYAIRFRDLQLAAIAGVLADHGIGRDVLPPEVLLVALTGVTQIISLESALGITAGHEETLAFIEELLARLEATPAPAGATAPTSA